MAQQTLEQFEFDHGRVYDYVDPETARAAVLVMQREKFDDMFPVPRPYPDR